MPELANDRTHSRPHYAEAARLYRARATIHRDTVKKIAAGLLPGAPDIELENDSRLVSVIMSRAEMRANSIQAIRCARRSGLPFSKVWKGSESA
jgi:hypothetical protein